VTGANTATSPDRAGNPNLKPEHANGLDFAYEKFFKTGGVISVNLFLRHINDLQRNVTTLENVSWSASPRYVSRPQNVGDARVSGIEFDAKFSLTELDKDLPAVNLKLNGAFYNSRVSGVPGPNNRIDQQPRFTTNLGADYKLKSLPLTVGGNWAYTPTYATQLSDVQGQTLSTKRVADVFAQWNFSSANKLRFSVSNLSPLDVVTTTTTYDAGLKEVVVGNGKTAVSFNLRLEMKI
jgi:iron complex outermembrane receptor protein